MSCQVIAINPLQTFGSMIQLNTSLAFSMPCQTVARNPLQAFVRVVQLKSSLPFSMLSQVRVVRRNLDLGSVVTSIPLKPFGCLVRLTSILFPVAFLLLVSASSFHTS